MNKNNPPPMNWQHALGTQGERTACDFLQAKGLRLLSKNFHSSHGEIDLIMQDGDDIVFVEVRQRSHLEYGHAVETINRSKQNKIIKTARYFILKYQWVNRNYRFDVIGIHSIKEKNEIEWIKNAFSVENL